MWGTVHLLFPFLVLASLLSLLRELANEGYLWKYILLDYVARYPWLQQRPDQFATLPTGAKNWKHAFQLQLHRTLGDYKYVPALVTQKPNALLVGASIVGTKPRIQLGVACLGLSYAHSASLSMRNARLSPGNCPIARISVFKLLTFS